jgi:choline dehydrogenase
MRKMVDGVRRGYELLTTGALKDISEGVAVLTDDMVNDTKFIEQYITDRSATIWHAVGTCKMGPASDNHAVVDPYLKVHECTSLRVVDCSIIPDHVSRNPMLTCYAIAERLVDLIRAGH